MQGASLTPRVRTTARHPEALQPSAIVAMAAMAAIATAITTITPFTAISIPPSPSSLTFPLPRVRRLMLRRMMDVASQISSSLTSARLSGSQGLRLANYAPL